MSDHIALENMRFQGRHGVAALEREVPQPFEVDVELHLDLRPAGLSDDLDRTVDYREVFEICRGVLEGESQRLIETLAELIAQQVLARPDGPVPDEVVVRVRKPQAPLPGPLDCAAVEITRRRAGEARS